MDGLRCNLKSISLIHPAAKENILRFFTRSAHWNCISQETKSVFNEVFAFTNDFVSRNFSPRLRFRRDKMEKKIPEGKSQKKKLQKGVCEFANFNCSIVSA
jgi:hypothetical protein